MKYLLLFAIITTLLSCITIHEEGMVFYEDFPRGKLWIDDKEIDLKAFQNIEGRRKYIGISFDQRTSNIWVWNYSRDFKYLFMKDITNDIYSSKNEIKITGLSNSNAYSFYLFNNMALAEYAWGFYALIDLETAEQNIVDLRGYLSHKDAGGTLGFDGDSILYDNGYYNLEKNIYCQYETAIISPRQIPGEKKIIGIDEDNYIIIYDVQQKSVKKEFAHHRSYNPTNYYEPDELYYFENGKIYLTKDTWLNRFSFLRSPAQRNWYRYEYTRNNKIVKKRIYTPSSYVKILGRMRF